MRKHIHHYFRNGLLLAGVEQNTTSSWEKLLSALGAFVGIAGVYWLSHSYLEQPASFMMVASMGATAVLVFAVPHGALSQPWPVLAGHLISAVIGIACLQLWPNYFWMPALAVGLAVGAMYYCRCIHPPGGATALTAAMGGEAMYSMGYDFVVFPVLVNVVSILVIAVIFNAPFTWRRYPAHWVGGQKAHAALPAEHSLDLTHEDFAAAMQELNSLIDVTPEDLARLFELAVSHAEQSGEHPAEIRAGHYYSNGQLGQRWRISQVIDAANGHRPGAPDRVIYKIVAGDGGYQTGLCSTEEFRQWARFEVVPHQGHWVRVDRPATRSESAALAR